MRSKASRARARASFGRGSAREQAYHHLLQNGLTFGRAEHLAAVADGATQSSAVMSSQIAPGEAHDTAIRRLHAGRDAQERRAARASQTPDGDQFADVELQRDIAEHNALSASTTIGLADVLELQQAHCWLGFPCADARKFAARIFNPFEPRLCRQATLLAASRSINSDLASTNGPSVEGLEASTVSRDARS